MASEKRGLWVYYRLEEAAVADASQIVLSSLPFGDGPAQ